MQTYSRTAPPETTAETARSSQWAPWAFPLEDEWKEDVHMHDRPLSVHIMAMTYSSRITPK